VPTHDEISLRGMRFHTLIGVLPHEAELRQPLEVDVTAYVARAGRGALVDYRELYAMVRGVVDGRRTSYLEDAAEEIASGALQQAGVERVRVAVRKPHVALGGPLDHAEVVVVRARDA
jgi:dihydroneopterin aldolase